MSTPDFPDVLHLPEDLRRFIDALEEHLAEEPPRRSEDLPRGLQEREAATWAEWDRTRENLERLIAWRLLGQVREIVQIRKEHGR